MINQIVDVEISDQGNYIARIVDQDAINYTVSLLEPVTPDESAWSFGEDVIIKKEQVSAFHDTCDIEDTGLYIKIDGNLYAPQCESDPDFDYSDTSDSESDISLDPED